MTRIYDYIVELVVEFFFDVIFFIGDNLKYLGQILNVLLPFWMLYIGNYCFEQRGQMAVGGEVLIPVFVMLISYFCRGLASKLGRGDTFPVPERRFTSVDEDDNPSIEKSRLQELILYIYDVEEWLKRKGRLRE